MKNGAVGFFLFVFSMACFRAVAASDTNSNPTLEIVRAIHDAAKWGGPSTNGVQIGVNMFLQDEYSAKKFDAVTYLYSSNLCNGLYYPPHGFRLELAFVDVNQKEIEKTKVGKTISKSSSSSAVGKLAAQSRPTFLDPSGFCRYEDPFNVLDCFKIEKPGVYQLKIGTVIYKRNNAEGVFPIPVPATCFPVTISQSDLDAYREDKASR